MIKTSEVTPIEGWDGKLSIPVTDLQSLTGKRVVMFDRSGSRIVFLTSGDSTRATISDGALLLDLVGRGWWLKQTKSPYRVSVLDGEGKLVKTFEGNKHFQFSVTEDGVDSPVTIEL